MKMMNINLLTPKDSSFYNDQREFILSLPSKNGSFASIVIRKGKAIYYELKRVSGVIPAIFN
jgi:hypothetical protein